MPGRLRKIWRRIRRVKCTTDDCNNLPEDCSFCKQHCIYANCPIHGKKEEGYDFWIAPEEKESRYMYKGEWMTSEDADRKKAADDVQIPSVKEIATELGIFPSEVEEFVKIAQEMGLVKCWIAEGEIYVQFLGDTIAEDLLDVPLKKLDEDNPMFG